MSVWVGRKIQSNGKSFLVIVKYQPFRCKINYISNLPSDHIHPFSSSTRTKREREKRRALTVEHRESRSHWKMDQSTMSTQWMTHLWAYWTAMSNPPLSRFDHHMNDPILDRTTMGDPLLDQAIIFRSTPCFHVTTTTAITKSPMNRSLSLSLFLSLDRSIMWFWFFCFDSFVSFCVYILRFSIIIFVWILGKCEKPDKNVFSRAFSRTQPNTKKYLSKHFLECNQTLENVFLFENIFTWKYFTLEFEKHFTLSQTQPKYKNKVICYIQANSLCHNILYFIVGFLVCFLRFQVSPLFFSICSKFERKYMMRVWRQIL